MIHWMAPYRIDKDLGRAYNDAFKCVGKNDSICFMDYDAMLLTPRSAAIIESYVFRNPNAGMLICYTNRIGSKNQLMGLSPNRDSNIINHIRLAESQEKLYPRQTKVSGDVSGFLMVISKKTWLKHKFIEGIGPLGVDTDYCRRIQAAGFDIIRMDAVYCWHTYRLASNGSKKHLL